MISYVLDADGFHPTETDIPTPGSGEVLVRTISCGVCSGDVHAYAHRDGIAKSLALGHECTGIVVRPGEDVSRYREGDIVTSLRGAYAEYYVDQADYMVELPSSLSPLHNHGEPVACFVHASRRFAAEPLQRAALIGCGYMGLGCQQMIRQMGNINITAIDLRNDRLAKARELGAIKTVNPAGRTPEWIAEELGEFDLVVEATGAAKSIRLATGLVRPHGKIVFVGYHQSEGGMRTVDMKTWNYKALDIVNGHVRLLEEKASAMAAGVELMATGKLAVSDLVTPYPHHRINEAFNDLLAGGVDLYKASIVFRDPD